MLQYCTSLGLRTVSQICSLFGFDPSKTCVNPQLPKIYPATPDVPCFQKVLMYHKLLPVPFLPHTMQWSAHNDTVNQEEAACASAVHSLLSDMILHEKIDNSKYFRSLQWYS